MSLLSFVGVGILWDDYRLPRDVLAPLIAGLVAATAAWIGYLGVTRTIESNERKERRAHEMDLRKETFLRAAAGYSGVVSNLWAYSEVRPDFKATSAVRTEYLAAHAQLMITASRETITAALAFQIVEAQASTEIISLRQPIDRAIGEWDYWMKRYDNVDTRRREATFSSEEQALGKINEEFRVINAQMEMSKTAISAVKPLMDEALLKHLLLVAPAFRRILAALKREMFPDDPELGKWFEEASVAQYTKIWEIDQSVRSPRPTPAPRESADACSPREE